jgi:hypothetical protein
MRTIILLNAFLLITPVAVSAISHANQPGHLGLGGIIGEPTGLSGKYTLTEVFALQGALGISLIEKGLWFSGDFLIHIHNILTHDGRLPLYVGGGFVLQDRGNSGKSNKGETSLGLRGLAGVEFLAQDRISIFGEASIQPFLFPVFSLGIGLAAGARYWF